MHRLLRTSLFGGNRQYSEYQYSQQSSLMSSLQALGIAGFRSYSTDSLQKIDFNKPLTLIWGKNGSGKTTIIEALKYITTGALPPSSERGKNFIIDPKMIGKSEVVGQVKLKFRAFNDRPVMATRRALYTINQKGSKFESIEQIIKTRDENGQLIEINHQCAEIEKQISVLLGTSKPVLQKIVFCHQDQSLWPFEDSATLKNIFDELFQTKKFTQCIDSMWDQRKEYQKKIGELKKALPYLERLYVQDQKKKVSALNELQNVNVLAVQMKDLKEGLQKFDSQMRRNSQQFKTERKYQLGKERRSLQQKHSGNKKIIAQGQSRIQILVKNYFQCNGKQFSSEKLSLQDLEAINNQLAQQNIKREQLKNQLDSLRMNDFLSQKELEINTQVKNAKEFLPECAKQKLSDEQICKKINEKSLVFEEKKRKLGSLKFELERCPLQPITLQVSMTQQQYNTEKNTMATAQKNSTESKIRILKYYFALYKDSTITSKQTQYFRQQNFQTKLSQIQYRIKIKTEELQHYLEMPSGPTLKEKIIKLRFAGIEFYEGYLEYCRQKGKCSLCSKTVTDEQLKTIRAKCDKMKEKTNNQIIDLQMHHCQNPNRRMPSVDPQEMIPKVKQEIKQLQSMQKQLVEKVKQYKKYLDRKEQIKLNQKLFEGIRVACLNAQVNKGAKALPQQSQKLPDACLDFFADAVKRYIELEKEIDRKRINIVHYDEQIKKNKEKQVKNEQNKMRRKMLIDEIGKLQEETKDFQIISRITKKLSLLLKTKEGMHRNKKITEKQQRRATMEEINSQLLALDASVRSLQMEKQIYELTNKTEELKRQNLKVQQMFKAIDTEIVQIETQIKNNRTKYSQFTELKIQYQTKQREIDLKAEIAFQEYHRSVQKDYLLEKCRLADAEEASKEIEIYCSAIETAISTIHKQKMDEVNKLIADIWREVYHGDDISLIEIQTQIEEDSKKKKNYHYSIVMQKAGLNASKVEMRGRCSMGQKVLASIVIRLALAEVFSNSARILALDQPTTFLDRNHINKLAAELCKLIEINEGGSLQLIIISHDLEFIKKLQKFTSNYYEISRDRNQFSIITCKEIRQLFSER